jgi:lipopolysaccharide/colanic/teichoic acid biosynthesis glycosyltransferase
MLKLEERLRHDLYYVENWSVWLDFVILARTLLVPIRDRNAY